MLVIYILSYCLYILYLYIRVYGAWGVVVIKALRY